MSGPRSSGQEAGVEGLAASDDRLAREYDAIRLFLSLSLFLLGRVVAPALVS